MGGEPLLGDAIPTLVATPDPSGPVVVSTPETPWYSGWPGRLAVELTEAADVVERHRGLSQRFVVGIHGLRLGKVERGPEQHRGVTVRGARSDHGWARSGPGDRNA